LVDKSINPQRCWQITSPRKGADIVRISDGEGVALVHVGVGMSAVVASSASALEVILEEGSRLEILRFFPLEPGQERDVFLNVCQKKDSFLTAFLMTKGSVSFKDVIKVVLEGPGAEISLNGLHDLKDTAQAQSFTFIDHVAPSTKSNQLYKSVVHDQAHSVFNGRIMVRREAQLTNAYQLNKNLILSPEARVDTRPQLEIFADDVKCSHGAAIGQLDDEQLFYFQTRGISRDAAGQMLVKGFIENVLESVKDPQLKTEVRSLL